MNAFTALDWFQITGYGPVAAVRWTEDRGPDVPDRRAGVDRRQTL